MNKYSLTTNQDVIKYKAQELTFMLHTWKVCVYCLARKNNLLSLFYSGKASQRKWNCIKYEINEIGYIYKTSKNDF